MLLTPPFRQSSCVHTQFQLWLKPIISILLRELERMQEPNEERLLASLVKGERALQM
jgi:hypothetical protein